MTTRGGAKPTVAGIDESTASIDPALWAVDKALHRGVPERLVDAGRTHGRREIEIATAATQGGPAEFLADDHADISRRHSPTESASNIPLAVIDGDDVSEPPRLIGPYDRGLLADARCSAAVVG